MAWRRHVNVHVWASSDCVWISLSFVTSCMQALQDRNSLVQALSAAAHSSQQTSACTRCGVGVEACSSKLACLKSFMTSACLAEYSRFAKLLPCKPCIPTLQPGQYVFLKQQLIRCMHWLRSELLPLAGSGPAGLPLTLPQPTAHDDHLGAGLLSNSSHHAPRLHD